MKLIDSLTKKKADYVMGLDASTNGVGFALFHGDELIQWGKIDFNGSDIFEKIKDAGDKMRAFMNSEPVDYICIESAVMVKSASTAIKLGYMFGAILYSVMGPDTNVYTIPPISWQSYIGNKNYTKAERQYIIDSMPGRPKSAIDKEIRMRRKQFTIDYFNKKYDIKVSDNDVSDAIGIAYYAINNLTESK